MKPSVAATYPTGWFTYLLRLVGRCVSAIQTSIKPRRASSSRRRPPGLAVTVWEGDGIKIIGADLPAYSCTLPATGTYS